LVAVVVVSHEGDSHKKDCFLEVDHKLPVEVGLHDVDLFASSHLQLDALVGERSEDLFDKTVAGRLDYLPGLLTRGRGFEAPTL